MICMTLLLGGISAWLSFALMRLSGWIFQTMRSHGGGTGPLLAGLVMMLDGKRLSYGHREVGLV